MLRYVAPELVVGVLSALPYALVLQQRQFSPLQQVTRQMSLDACLLEQSGAMLTEHLRICACNYVCVRVCDVCCLCVVCFDSGGACEWCCAVR
jgi:hypothetical protein